MGFTINKTITTELSWKEVALITMVCGNYQESYGETADKEVLKTIERLVNRLSKELYDHSDNDKPNGH